MANTALAYSKLPSNTTIPETERRSDSLSSVQPEYGNDLHNLFLEIPTKLRICKSLNEIVRNQLKGLCQEHVTQFQSLYTQADEAGCEQEKACLAIDGDRAYEASQDNAEICGHYHFPLFLFAFGLFESSLVSACQHLSAHTSIATTVPWGRTIPKTKLTCWQRLFARKKNKVLTGVPRIPYFLEKNYNLKNVFSNDIHDLIKIRNCIAHANGDLSLVTNRPQVAKTIKRLEPRGYGIDDNIVYMSDDALEWSINQFLSGTIEVQDALIQHKTVGPVIFPGENLTSSQPAG